MTDFELESGNGNVEGQTNGQKTDKGMDGIKNGQMNRRNYTNFERNLAMMVIYLPEFDWTNRFRVRVRKQKCGRTDRQTDVRHINLIGGLVTRNPPKKFIHGNWNIIENSDDCAQTFSEKPIIGFKSCQSLEICTLKHFVPTK